MVRVRSLIFCAAMIARGMALAEDGDALDLPGASPPSPAADQKPPSTRIYLEGSLGRVEAVGGGPSEKAHRFALDVRHHGDLPGRFRYTISDRFDSVDPALPGQRASRNSLREAHVSWQDESGAWAFDIGRVNVRNGPAYGFNPTDYFRFGALTVLTTADPVALRENRLGTYLVRASTMVSDASVALVVAPKLDESPDNRTFTFDAAATNSTRRALVSVGASASDKANWQLFMFGESGRGPQFGASFNSLLSGSTVAYAEASVGRGKGLYDLARGRAGSEQRITRLAAGLTQTFASRLSVTLEYQYNDAGLKDAEWAALLAEGPVYYRRFLNYTQSSMELGARQAWLLYGTLKNAGVKNLDVTGFVRRDALDHGRMSWIEARYRWDRFDVALQWQHASPGGQTQLVRSPYRQAVQLVGTWYF